MLHYPCPLLPIRSRADAAPRRGASIGKQHSRVTRSTSARVPFRIDSTQVFTDIKAYIVAYANSTPTPNRPTPFVQPMDIYTQ